MKFFQKPYNWIKNLSTPEWLKVLLNKIIRPILSGIGEYVIQDIKNTVRIVAVNDDWSNEEKFAYVFDHIMGMYPDLKENALGIAIKVAVAELKF